MIDAVLVKKANRMMTVASLLEDGIELGFADGAKARRPRCPGPLPLTTVTHPIARLSRS